MPRRRAATPKRPRPRRYRLRRHADQLVVSPAALDLVGVFVFALSGGLVAVKKRFDLFGVLVLACAAGSRRRDHARPAHRRSSRPSGISDWRLLPAAALGGLVTFLFHPGVERISRLVKVLDAVGLAAFAVARQPQGLARPACPRWRPFSSASSPPSVAASSATCSPARCPRCCAASCTRCRPSSGPRSSSSAYVRAASSRRSSLWGAPRSSSSSGWWRCVLDLNAPTPLDGQLRDDPRRDRSR